VKVASAKQVEADFGGYLKASQQGPVVVTRNGAPVAVLLRTRNLKDLERLLMGHSPKLQSILEEARTRFRAGIGIPHDEFWKKVEAENAGRFKERNRGRKNG